MSGHAGLARDRVLYEVIESLAWLMISAVYVLMPRDIDVCTSIHWVSLYSGPFSCLRAHKKLLEE